MLLRLLRAFNAWYALVIFWGYLLAFALAFTMVIVFFPVGALAILFTAIGVLPVLYLVGAAFRAWERAWCRAWLRSGRCPTCLEHSAIGPVDPERVPAALPQIDDPIFHPAYSCVYCGALFQASGEPAEIPPEDQRAAVAAA